MSTSPTNHYYASRPSSRSTSRTGDRPISPQTNAEVRSQAVAKLKRAASLPRTPNGRRPSLGQQPSQPQVQAQAPVYQLDEVLHSTHSSRAGPSAPPISSSSSGDQEVLSPSPVDASFDHANIYPSPVAAGMQRSASAASSYHMATTPSHIPYGSPMSAPYYANTPPSGVTPDWAAMQLAHSYLPTLTPTGLSPNPYPHSVPVPGPGGRNTPSPLPTLGELRTLQRSNSNAARAKAMSKLTGGRDTPSHEDHALQDTPTRAGGVGLQRAGTLGAPRMLGIPLTQSRDNDHAATKAKEEVSNAFDEPRPRLQRSFTVSSSNMGEERRSAVGRRMVERLAERRAARQKEEEEVRRLWEHRRAITKAEEQEYDETEDPEEDEHDQQEEDDDQGASGDDHVDVASTSDTDPHLEVGNPSSGLDVPLAADRSVSRGTMVSTQEPFEYESHLRRSLSSRTARGNIGGVVEPVPTTGAHAESREGHAEHLQGDIQPTEDDLSAEDAVDDDSPLLPPQPSFATPTRNTPHSSTSTQSTMQGSQSPGSSTLSGLDSMMFVVGGTGGPGVPGLRGPDRHGEHNWPSEVEGSDWGTPAKEHQATFADSPEIQHSSRLGHNHFEGGSSQNGHDQDAGQSSPPSRDSTRPESMMSWEEVGGKEDQEARVPSDAKYHKKSGSISAKIGRTVKQAMRKRSQSRSSVTSSNMSPPTSPRHLNAGFVRRESESSVSPSQASISRSMSRNGHSAKHQPSINSLSPSISVPSETSANSDIIQHQLTNDPSQVSFLPRANLNDPRIHSAKLSPFPGIVQLEARKNSESGHELEEPPRLLHQVSDSVVPSVQRSAPDVGGVGESSIYSLPLPSQDHSSRRASTDSVTKRSWLTKAFGQQTSPRSSGSLSRKNSASVASHGTVNTLGQGATIISSDVDPFAGPPPPPTNIKPIRHRSISPAIPMVPEVSEEASRSTKYNAANVGVGSSVHEEGLEEEERPDGDDVLPQKSMDVLSRMDEVLALSPDDPQRPDILDDPPRKLLLSTQVLQIVNVHTVKDRYLFLFNDILVITKPIITHGISATLDMKFVVKSIVSLDKLAISGFSEEPTTEPERHPVVTNFIERFAEDSTEACDYLVERSRPKVDLPTLASLIFKTPELDKTQVGNLLASHETLMKGFIDRLHLVGEKIHQSLRMFLLSLRLPTEPTACETLLRGFAYRYIDANRNIVSYHAELATDLVLAIMQFNDALYGTFGFALPNHAINRETFITAFQSKDPKGLVPVDLLAEIYESVRSAPLVQALSSDESSLERGIIVTPSRIPTKLTYNVWSDTISVRIQAPDAQFQIRLLGEGLEFDPPVLDFTTSHEISFRTRGVTLGPKSLLFDRVGSNAALYPGIGNTRHFVVERAFMRNTFHVAFISHTGLRRKYCFSVQDPEQRTKWGKTLARQIRVAKNINSQPITNVQQQIRHTAEAVSIQVLRDALIPPEDKSALTSSNLANGLKTGGTGTKLIANTDKTEERGRSGSVSIAYTQHALKEEYDLGPLQATRAGNPSDRQSGMVDIQTGKELVLLCRQNSLMPGLLELLHAGKGTNTGNVGGVNGIAMEEGGLGRTGSGRSKGVRV
ncbi:hypothetical protein CI109_102851 [Kwoniella shandongensis]|uniref:Uncharacterized protein n=1 Tax=Kwoniella shandongensis TaxID=1734106 RepID=A0A5M6C880_9TREE|nr:uncharacterized protein CI109_000041 [Kwoniella shandongensis]KAA5531203.1 hypothetical protein CI109_000041 [Kwoniella shandongensis]